MSIPDNVPVRFAPVRGGDTIHIPIELFQELLSHLFLEDDVKNWLEGLLLAYPVLSEPNRQGLYRLLMRRDLFDELSEIKAAYLEALAARSGPNALEKILADKPQDGGQK
jgi:hypothetical protein